MNMGIGIGMLRSLNTLLHRTGLGRLASTFGGRRDMFNVLGYPTEISVEKYRWRYERGDIAAAIIDAYPEDTWRGDGEVVENDDPTVITEFEKTFAALNKRLCIWQIFQQADILAQLGRYSIIVIGAPGDSNTPLPNITADEVFYLIAYGEDSASFTETDLEKDTKNPRFGLPNFYQITSSGTTARSSITSKFHYTRIIHVVDNRLDHRLLGIPRLKKVWNRLEDLDKIMGGGSEAFWQRANKGTIFNIDPDVLVGDPEEGETEPQAIRDMKEQVEEFGHGTRRTLTLRGVEAQDLGAEVADFASPVASIVSIVSGAERIPQRLLLGSERGELASTQDRQNWSDRIKSRRSRFADPVVVRPFVDRLIEAGALPAVQDYHTVWPDVFELSETEKMTLASQAASLNTRAGDVVVLPEEIRERYLGLPAFTAEQEGEIEAEKEAELEREDELLDKQLKSRGKSAE